MPCFSSCSHKIQLYEYHIQILVDLVIYALTLDMNILQVLNQIVYELPAEHPLAESRPLRELLGHTPPQVSILH